MTDAELAILSLLAEGPNYDHTLNDLIEQRGMRRWTAIGTSSMYYVLDKLEKQGLVRKMVEETGRRRFRISSAGMGVLQTAMVDLLSTPHSHDKYFEIGLANLHILKTSQVRSALLSRQHDLTTQIEKITITLNQESAQDNNFQVRSLFAHRIAMLKAELAWLNAFLDAWEKQAKPDPEMVIEASEIPRSRQVVLPQDPDSIHKQRTQPLAADRKLTPPSSRGKTGRLKRPDMDMDPDATNPIAINPPKPDDPPKS
ncbi:MAG: PadR family transcriptional regulator [Anaerolineae bacterium]|nr:PadR family transcriptional regulator [Anaerolineae bacterium]